jgi:hypothetical protein
VVQRVALAGAATSGVTMAARQADRHHLIRALEPVLARLWEGRP